MIDIQQYKQVLSQFPTGVCVITTKNADGYSGITVNSFASVSLEPALILWSIDKSTYSLDDYLNAKTFAISFLSEQQQEISNHFATKSHDDKFAHIDYSLQHNLPVINNAVGTIICQTDNIVEAGDHYIILGKVLEASAKNSSSNDPQSLVYYRSQYANVSCQ